MYLFWILCSCILLNVGTVCTCEYNFDADTMLKIRKTTKTSNRVTWTKSASLLKYLIMFILTSFLYITFFGGIKKELKKNEEDLPAPRRITATADNENKKTNKPVLTLVTTFADHTQSDREKISVQNNTLFNWAKLRPFVCLVLFTNDLFWMNIAKSAGWEVLKPDDEIDGDRPPVLKSMLRSAMNLHETAWYGYINADILLTSDLITNIDTISEKYNISNTRIMLTGRRTNVGNFSSLDPTSDESIRDNADKYGTLYKEDAEDFFITTKNFPWKDILPLVVGRPAYDNWLVAEARCRLNTIVIDVTKTFLAFHQTTLKGGNLEGHSHPESNYNFKLLKRTKRRINLLAGITDCIVYETVKSIRGTLDLKRKQKLGRPCSCKPSPLSLYSRYSMVRKKKCF